MIRNNRAYRAYRAYGIYSTVSDITLPVKVAALIRFAFELFEFRIIRVTKAVALCSSLSLTLRSFS